MRKNHNMTCNSSHVENKLTTQIILENQNLILMFECKVKGIWDFEKNGVDKVTMTEMYIIYLPKNPLITISILC